MRKKYLKLENRKILDVQVKARPYHESTGSKKRSTVADTNTSNDMLVWLTVEIGLVETTKEEIMKTRKWTRKRNWINPIDQRRWAKPPDTSTTILLEPSKNI